MLEYFHKFVTFQPTPICIIRLFYVVKPNFNDLRFDLLDLRETLTTKTARKIKQSQQNPHVSFSFNFPPVMRTAIFCFRFKILTISILRNV